MSSFESTVSKAVAMICKGSLTAIPVRFLPKSIESILANVLFIIKRVKHLPYSKPVAHQSYAVLIYQGLDKQENKRFMPDNNKINACHLNLNRLEKSKITC